MKNITFKVVKLNNHPFGYKYNCQVYLNGIYAGYGRFCKTLTEVNAFKRKVMKEYKGGK